MAELTIRWATEDPNPGEKKAEDKRIAKEGQKVIASKLDENLIEAAQSLRALEDGDVEDLYHIEASEDVPAPATRSGGGGGDERPAKKARTADNGPEGLIGGDALDNIKYYAEMARKQAEEERTRKAPAKPAAGMALLGGYGSDSD